MVIVAEIRVGHLESLEMALHVGDRHVPRMEFSLISVSSFAGNAFSVVRKFFDSGNFGIGQRGEKGER